jgi:phosphate-induced protein 1
MKLRLFGVLVVSLGVCAAPLGAGVVKKQGKDRGQPDLTPTGKGWGEDKPGAPAAQDVPTEAEDAGQAGPASRKPSSNGINYHGGPLILGTTNVYYIWYGNWSGNTATTILTSFASTIGGSPYFNINTTYYDGNNVHVSNAVHYAGSMDDSYSHGTSLSDSAIQAIVSSAITTGALPEDSNAVYFVLTSADVTASSGFCTQYCGWHTHATISGSDIKYSFVGNPDRCPSACEEQTTGPNGNAGADGMASIIAHELEEAVTDPDLNAWYDRRGAENADKCAWTFGPTSTASNGSLYNVTLGGNKYLIQQNWVNASGGYCSMSY